MYLTRQMCKRARTRAAEGKRKETAGLNEIDEEATEAKTKSWSPKDKLELNIVRTGSKWIRQSVYNAGQGEDTLCQLCGEEEDTART